MLVHACFFVCAKKKEGNHANGEEKSNAGRKVLFMRMQWDLAVFFFVVLVVFCLLER